MPERPQHRYGPSQIPYEALAHHVHTYPIRYSLTGGCSAPMKDGTTELLASAEIINLEHKGISQ
jgi:hypothetical protein